MDNPVSDHARTEAGQSRMPATGNANWLADPAHEAPVTGTRVCVIGAGFVGLVTAAGLAQSGHTVVCVEKNEQKAAELANGDVSLYERDLPEMVNANLRRKRLSFSTDLASSVVDQDVILVAVSTPPSSQGQVDLTAFDEVLATLATVIRPDQVVVIKSTVPVGTARRAAECLNRTIGKTGQVPVVSCPEFLRESTAIYDYFHPARIVVGGSNREAVDRVVRLYRAGLAEAAPIVVTENEIAELVKYAANVYLAMRLSYINELSAVCDALHVAVGDVAYTMGLDRRIGSKYLAVGPGFGGSCLPKDLDAYIAMAERLGIDLVLAPAIRESNQRHLARTVQKVRGVVGGDFKGKRIGALGLAFKAHTHDVRSSPALAVIQVFLSEGAVVRAFDPAAMAQAQPLIPQVTMCETALDVATEADALVLLTEWPEFQVLDWAEARRRMPEARIVDARNLLSPEMMRRHGFLYVGLGQ